MNAHLARNGATEFHDGPIVACGIQGAMPHNRGSGVLKAHQFIVIDCFPRHANGYWGDLTRTVLKGKPTEWHTKVYNAVLKSQKLRPLPAQTGGGWQHHPSVRHRQPRHLRLPGGHR